MRRPHPVPVIYLGGVERLREIEMFIVEVSGDESLVLDPQLVPFDELFDAAISQLLVVHFPACTRFHHAVPRVQLADRFSTGVPFLVE